jgi:hypothetical protein
VLKVKGSFGWLNLSPVVPGLALGPGTMAVTVSDRYAVSA